MAKPVCLITGVGDGTGAALARRFAKGGYQVAMLARNRDRLERLEKDIADAKAYVCDMTDLEALLATVESVRAEIGVPSVLVHNAVSATFKTFLEADPEDLEWNFRVNTTSLLYLARALAPAMVAAGHGAIMVTGNTAALRGFPHTRCLPRRKQRNESWPSPWPVIWGRKAFMSPSSRLTPPSIRPGRATSSTATSRTTFSANRRISPTKYFTSYTSRARPGPLTSRFAPMARNGNQR